MSDAVYAWLSSAYRINRVALHLAAAALIAATVETVTSPSHVLAQWRSVGLQGFSPAGEHMFTFGRRLFVTVDSGVFVSSDLGASWSKDSLANSVGGTGLNLVTSFDTLDGFLFAAGGPGLWRSNDSGVKWEGPSQPAANEIAFFHHRLFGARGYEGLCYADNLTPTSWQDAAWSTPVVPGRSWLVRSFDSVIVADIRRPDSLGLSGGPTCSWDGGLTWSQQLKDFATLCIGGTRSLLLCGTYLTSEQAANFKSTDYGRTWQQIANSPLDSASIYDVLASGNRIFTACEVPASQWFDSATNIVVYESSDQGNTWRDFSAGLPAKDHPASLSIVGNYLFLSTWHSGVWRRSLSELGVRTAQLVRQETATVYPNPTNGRITIFGAVGEVRVTNMLGEQVSSANFDAQHSGGLDLSNLPSGTYFIRIEAGQGVVMRKVVKE